MLVIEVDNLRIEREAAVVADVGGGKGTASPALAAAARLMQGAAAAARLPVLGAAAAARLPVQAADSWPQRPWQSP